MQPAFSALAVFMGIGCTEIDCQLCDDIVEARVVMAKRAIQVEQDGAYGKDWIQEASWSIVETFRRIILDPTLDQFIHFFAFVV